MFSLHMTSEIPKKPNHNFDEKCMRRRSPKESGQIFNTGKCHRLELMGGGHKWKGKKFVSSYLHYILGRSVGPTIGSKNYLCGSLNLNTLRNLIFEL